MEKDNSVLRLAEDICKYIIELEQQGNPVNLIGIKVPVAALYQQTDQTCSLIAYVQLCAYEILEREGYRKRFIVVPVGTSNNDEVFDMCAGICNSFEPEPLKKLTNKAEVEAFKQEIDKCKKLSDLLKFMGVKPEDKE